MEIRPDLALLDFGIVDVHERPLRKEVPNESDRCGLSGVTSIRLECESKNGNTLYNPKDLNLYLKF